MMHSITASSPREKATSCCGRFMTGRTGRKNKCGLSFEFKMKEYLLLFSYEFYGVGKSAVLEIQT